MRFNRIAPFMLAPLASAQYFNVYSTTTLQPQTPAAPITTISTITSEIAKTVYLTLSNGEVSSQVSTATPGEVTTVVTTPTSSDDATLTVSDDTTSTTTVTIYHTISEDDASSSTTSEAAGSATIAGDKLNQVYADDATSTLTTTMLQTITLSNSAGEATATTVSTVGRELLLGNFSCVPETVTVTEYQATKYITVEATSSPAIRATSAYYGNSTVSSLV